VQRLTRVRLVKWAGPVTNKTRLEFMLKSKMALSSDETMLIDFPLKQSSYNSIGSVIEKAEKSPE